MPGGRGHGQQGANEAGARPIEDPSPTVDRLHMRTVKTEGQTKRLLP